MEKVSQTEEMVSTTKDRTSKIRGVLEAEGACCVGFADVSSLRLPVTREYPFGICFAIRHDDAVVNQLPNDELWLQMSSALTDKARQIYQVVGGLLESWGYEVEIAEYQILLPTPNVL